MAQSAEMDPREVFATFRASCLTRAKEIRDFIARRVSFGLDFKETLELREMRRAMEDQFACMEETWDNLLECIRLNAIDNDAAFGELVGVMKSTKRVVDAALLMSEQFTRASPVCTDQACRLGSKNLSLNLPRSCHLVIKNSKKICTFFRATCLKKAKAIQDFMISYFNKTYPKY